MAGSSEVAPWRSAAAQVIVDDLADPTLQADDLHHLSRVLRLRAGAEVCATDGVGGWRSCSFSGDALDPLDEVRQHPRPEYPVTVAFALVKGERPELVVQKLTELGVDRIVPFAARRSVVRWDESRAAKQMDRLRRVARESCGQCRRLWVPTVGLDPTGAEPAPQLATFAQVHTPGAVLADAGGRPLRRSDHTVVIGPEGGWDPSEVDGADCIGLGENILRAETAAIAVGVALTALRVGLVAEVLESSP